MLRRTVLATIAWTFGCAIAAAQMPDTPGEEHEGLKQFVGSWDAQIDMFGQKSKGSAVYKLICGGMWLESDFEGDMAGAKFEGHGLDGYDLRKKKYVSVWVDSMQSAPMQFEGSLDPKTKQVVMTGQSVDPSGNPQKFKNTNEFKDKDHFTFKMYMVMPDGSEQLAFTIDYTRRKAAAKP